MRKIGKGDKTESRTFSGALVRLAVHEPEVLRLIGEESRRKGTDRLSSRDIDQVIEATRLGVRRAGH